MSDKRKELISYFKILKRIRYLLLTKISRDFLIFLFFIFVAFFFWIIQTLNDPYEAELAIPVRLTNVPKNAIITSDIPKELRVTLRDRGTVLMNYFLGAPISPVVINYLDFYNGKSNIDIPSDIFRKNVVAQLSQSTKLLSIKPDTINLIYTLGSAKKIPVVLRGDITPGKQYYISNIACHPDSVNVYAPSSILDTIKAAYTVAAYQPNITENKKIKINIEKIKGAKFVPSFVDATLSVDIYTEKSLEVAVVGINFPEGKSLRTFPSKVRLNFQVGLNHVKSVKPDDFFLCVDYHDIVNSKGDECAVNLMSYPSFVKHITINPSTVDYLIEE